MRSISCLSNSFSIDSASEEEHTERKRRKEKTGSVAEKGRKKCRSAVF